MILRVILDTLSLVNYLIQLLLYMNENKEN